MSKSTSTYLLLLLSILPLNLIWGQKESSKEKESLRTADQLYENLGYKAAIPLYEGGVIDLTAMVRIANGYRLNHDTENAEKWYAEVIKVSDQPIHVLHYAQALQSNQRLEQARKQYLRYNELVMGTQEEGHGQRLANAIDRMNALQHTEIKIINVQEVNTERLDFSPSYFKDGIVFVSTRGDVNRAIEQKDIWMDDNFMALYYAEQGEGQKLTEPKEFSYHLTTKYHEGPVTFSKDGQRIFFTRNNYNKGKRRNSKKGVMKLKIYTAVQNEEGWSEAKELAFNTDEYEECHPSLSANGSQLYFASNRPGGYGGMDIYYTKFEKGKWSDPINLGPDVNTSGNEVFPFIHDDGTLYFASNGWGGVGGLDIFSTTLNAGEEWQKAQNIGTPFNSPKDDFGFILNVLGTEGYLTSARTGGLGKDDIYRFHIPPKKSKEKELLQAITVCTYLEADGERVAGVDIVVKEQKATTKTMASLEEDYIVKLTPTAQKEEFYLSLKKRDPLAEEEEESTKNYRTNAQGQIEMRVRQDRIYTIVARKQGYQLAEKQFIAKDFDFLQTPEWCLPLIPQNCPALEGIVTHKRYRNRIPNASITLMSLCTGETIEVMADAKGSFDFPCLACNCEFVVIGEKDNFDIDQKRVSTVNLDCAKAGPIQVELVLDNNFEGLLADMYDKGDNLEVGTVIELKNIYYDFDESYIRSAAALDLDKVVMLMKRYPSLIIELASHTDARGTDSYNQQLSQRRAEAAVDYIIAQNIDPRRLVAKGYGETQPRNACRNYVDCTEEEHQFNRRTAIKVLQFDQDEIKVKYIDNAPDKIDRADPKRKYSWD